MWWRVRGVVKGLVWCRTWMRRMAWHARRWMSRVRRVCIRHRCILRSRWSLGHLLWWCYVLGRRAWSRHHPVGRTILYNRAVHRLLLRRWRHWCSRRRILYSPHLSLENVRFNSDRAGPQLRHRVFRRVLRHFRIGLILRCRLRPVLLEDALAEPFRSRST